ncbi:Rap1 GTPase-GDP dissociation stimulator 1 [Chelonia mydas]|uniref:Rap1 GTPase-GDP dissociation stimulator 1 n=1 Tax=Chelonia mydas TaxID=8469 RepID=M7BXH2_CHEMY|nr:Rap1 GTPase-GDP dissociation stimulator 1 [Chelonia mydas]
MGGSQALAGAPHLPKDDSPSCESSFLVNVLAPAGNREIDKNNSQQPIRDRFSGSSEDPLNQWQSSTPVLHLSEKSKGSRMESIFRRHSAVKTPHYLLPVPPPAAASSEVGYLAQQTNTETSEKIQKSGILQVFASLLTPQSSCTAKVANIIAEVAKNEFMRNSCVDAGLIPPLVQLLNCKDQEVLLQTGRALGNICYDSRDIVNKKRAALSPANVNNLVRLSDWLNKK